MRREERKERWMERGEVKGDRVGKQERKKGGKREVAEREKR